MIINEDRTAKEIRKIHKKKMKMKSLTVMVIALALSIAALQLQQQQQQGANAIKRGECPDMKFLWSRTYGAGLLVHGESSRLKELSPECVVFDGVVSGTPSTREGDGDLHILLIPDDQDDKDLMNSANNGKMTAEIICWEKPGQSYTDKWGQFCEGVDPRQYIPALKNGDHVRVTGKWVQDIGYPKPEHPQWNEIHPVQSIQKLNP